MTAKIDLTGRRFGRLFVISEDDKKTNNRIRWKCICECGKTTSVQSNNLTSGNVKSCGCLMRELSASSNTTHNLSKSWEYKVWKGIKARCLNPNNPRFKHYGARGIFICERWKNSFENFIKDIGPAPSTKHQIDRINNNDGYFNENCRWVTRTESLRNQQKSKWWFVNGVRYESSAHAASALGVSSSTIENRVNRKEAGYSSERKYPSC